MCRGERLMQQWEKMSSFKSRDERTNQRNEDLK